MNNKGINQGPVHSVQDETGPLLCPHFSADRNFLRIRNRDEKPE